MDVRARFSIRGLLLYTVAVAFLVAAPLHAHRVELSHIGSSIVWLAYNGLVLAVTAFPLWIFTRHSFVVPGLAVLMFASNFGPEVATVADFLITGTNDATSVWLAERGLDYDPLVSIPCWCSIVASG